MEIKTPATGEDRSIVSPLSSGRLQQRAGCERAVPEVEGGRAVRGLFQRWREGEL
jgi:hypothetical protein